MPISKGLRCALFALVAQSTLSMPIGGTEKLGTEMLGVGKLGEKSGLGLELGAGLVKSPPVVPFFSFKERPSAVPPENPAARYFEEHFSAPTPTGASNRLAHSENHQFGFGLELEGHPEEREDHRLKRIGSLLNSAMNEIKQMQMQSHDSGMGGGNNADSSMGGNNADIPDSGMGGGFGNNPVTAAPVTTAPVTATPVTTAPVTTTPVTTAPVTTAPVTTTPGATAPGTHALGTPVLGTYDDAFFGESFENRLFRRNLSTNKESQPNDGSAR